MIDPTLMYEPTKDHAQKGDKSCPKCKQFVLHYGFGLAGGGYGPYTYCQTKDCNYFTKLRINNV